MSGFKLQDNLSQHVCYKQAHLLQTREKPHSSGGIASGANGAVRIRLARLRSSLPRDEVWLGASS